jgi:integrase/recombinase XerC
MTNLPEKNGNDNTIVQAQKMAFRVEYKEAARDYISYIKNVRRYSLHTVESYSTSLEKFGKYIFDLDVISLEGITLKMLRRYVVLLSEKLLKPGTINHKIHCLSSFFRHCLRTGRLKHNRAKLLHQLKTLSKIPVYLSEAEMNHFYNNTITPTTFAGIRNRYIIDLLYSSGLRLSELVNLKESHIEYDMLKVVQGKGGYDRYVPLPRKFVEYHQLYLKAKRKHYRKHKTKKAKEEPLIVTMDCKPVPRWLVRRAIRKCFPFIKDKEVTPHTFRHTYATHLLNRGASIMAIKDLLGHKSVATTARYTHIAVSKLVEIHKQHFPSTDHSLKQQTA